MRRSNRGLTVPEPKDLCQRFKQYEEIMGVGFLQVDLNLHYTDVLR